MFKWLIRTKLNGDNREYKNWEEHSIPSSVATGCLGQLKNKLVQQLIAGLEVTSEARIAQQSN